MPKQRPSAESWVAVAAHQAGAGMGAMDQYRRSQADDVAASLRTSGGDRHGGPLRSQSAGATLDQSGGKRPSPAKASRGADRGEKDAASRTACPSGVAGVEIRARDPRRSPRPERSAEG